MSQKYDDDYFFSILLKMIGVFCGLIISFIIYMEFFVGPKQLIEEQKATAEWAAKGCPVFKSQCGSSRRPYECERRGVVVGRNQVGDIFVDAYPICKAPK